MPTPEVSLPIDVVPDSDPPKFRWRQTVSSLNGKRVVDHEGMLPPTVEVAVERLVHIAKQLLHDLARSQARVEELEKQVESHARPKSVPTKR